MIAKAVRNLFSILTIGSMVFLLASCQQEASLPGGASLADGGDYGSYTCVVVAEDTPEEVLRDLSGKGITPVEYNSGTSLISPHGGALWAELAEGSSIYLCEGTYECELGTFIDTGGLGGLSIIGAGEDKTVIAGGGGLRDNTGSAIHISSSGVSASGLTAAGFENGVWIDGGEDVSLSNVTLRENRYAGIRLDQAENCVIENCTLLENGLPYGADYGYGLSISPDSVNNSGSGNLYKNNANRNAIDFLERGEADFPPGNRIEFEMIYDIEREEKTIIDPLEEAKNAKPSANAIRVECEDGALTGASASTSTERVPSGFSGNGYVFLFDGTITLKVTVPAAGNYRVFVSGTPDEPNNKCDYVSVNGGPEYLTSFFGDKRSDWQLSQPGTEYWENNVLRPQPVVEGFALKQGENTIAIRANWGYCAYDCIYVDRIAEGAVGDGASSESPSESKPLSTEAGGDKDAASGQGLGGAIQVECETGVLTGAAESVSTEKVAPYSGNGYVFLFDGTITMKVNLPEAGNYRLYVCGTTDEPNDKCDCVSVNGGAEYLVSYQKSKQGGWQLSEPGTEYWENNELRPQPPENGFSLNQGENTVVIRANWGYCAYDYIRLEKA